MAASNQFEQLIKEKTDMELIRIITNFDDYQPEFIELAKKELLEVRNISANNHDEYNELMKFRDFRDMIVSLLSERGHYTDVKENHIILSYRDGTIVVYLEDTQTITVDYHFFTFDREDTIPIWNNVNSLNHKYKFIRFLVSNELCISARNVEPIDITLDIAYHFWRMFDSVVQAADHFMQELRTQNEKNNNNHI